VRNARRPGVATLALGTLLLCACVLTPPTPEVITKEVLSRLPQVSPQPAPPRAATVLVLAPDTVAVYDTTQMAYTKKPYEVAYFSHHEWAERPAQMLQPLLAETLRRTQAFGAVLTPPHTGRASYTLRSEIVDLLQDFTTQPASFRLGLHVEVSDEASGKVLASKDIALREAMHQGTPEAGAAAANAAIAKALDEVARMVLDKAR